MAFHRLHVAPKLTTSSNFKAVELTSSYSVLEGMNPVVGSDTIDSYIVSMILHTKLIYKLCVNVCVCVCVCVCL